MSPRVAIIGAGLGGIATAVKLKQAGIEDFVVFEQSPAPGGVWWENKYPDCEVDAPSQLYSYSFMPYDWTRTHAKRAEIQRYIEDTIDRFGIRGNFRFVSRVGSIVWRDRRSSYTVRLATGEEEHFDAVVSCVGLLNRPTCPTWPGLERFAGAKFHTARWESQHDLTGKKVALVGTGSTGAQVSRYLAEASEHLYVYQREPGWILPKYARDLRSWTRRLKCRWPWIQKLERCGWWLVFDFGLRDLFKAGSIPNRLTEKLCRRYIAKRIAGAQLRVQVTPSFPLGCKRPIFDDTFYRTLARDNVTLVPHAVTALTETGIVSEDGGHRTVDVLVMATGFQAQDYLASLRVKGTGGRDLHEVWAGEPRAFLGITVPGFPNFFIVNGPNTNGGNSITFQLERQADVAVRAISRLCHPGDTVDTLPAACELYDRWIAKQIRKRFTAANFCHNYYFSPTGRNVTQWPRGGLDYWILTRVLPPLAMRFRHADRSASPPPVAQVAGRSPGSEPSAHDGRTRCQPR
jgi:cation diffusion facilitator CzcD-associated flavoprotein CzcO